MILLALINDWASSIPPDIYSFTPYIYDIALKCDHVEILVPCNQGNWIDCTQSTENSKEINLYILFDNKKKIFFLRLYLRLCQIS